MTANEINALVDRLREQRNLSDAEFKTILETDAYDAALQKAADEVRRAHYGTDVYVRGLIEFTNYCKNNCYYCGIRRDNRNATRYRLTKEEILSCCAEGYDLGFRTFVLQGGEDPFYTDPEHYGKLHPNELSALHRQACLFDLKDIGYQVGSGFMVGSPYQTTENLISDLRFLQKLQPDMIGIGPYITHAQTPFANEKSGSLELTLRLLSILRLLFPYALLPSTTALGTIHPQGRELGLKAGGNVVMPNLSPVRVRKLYELYENKICTGEEAAQCRGCLEQRVKSAGYEIVTARGDVKR